MTEITQILLIVVVIVLTVILTLVGIQVIGILKEFKKTVIKTNKILDDSGEISETVAKQVTSVSGLVSGITSGLSIFNFLKRRKNE